DSIKTKLDLHEVLKPECCTQDKIEAVRGHITDIILTESSQANSPLSRDQVQELTQTLLDELTGYGPIGPLLRDPAVSEVMVNGPREVFVERNGKLVDASVTFRDEEQVRFVAERIASPLGRRLDATQPYVDARLPDGSRVNIVIPPLAMYGTYITIRKFTQKKITLESLVTLGTISRPAAAFVTGAVQGRINIIVSGGTGSGKTTLLNIIGQEIPADERVVTIEDAAELQLNRRNVAALETRPADVEGKGLVTTRDLVRNALRMRPNRIIVGEVRGAEALDMLQAMNTGHDGSMATVHANAPRDTLARIETMVMMAGFELSLEAIRAQIASACQLIIQLDRQPGGKRRVTRITEIQGMEGNTIVMQDIYAYDRAGDKLTATGLVPKLNEQLKQRGVNLPVSLFRGTP
ncbi:MAG TPA: CpaF family protein, partial [bacterium]|nr:CpaF family protein [bacterium]